MQYDKFYEKNINYHANVFLVRGLREHYLAAVEPLRPRFDGEGKDCDVAEATA